MKQSGARSFILGILLVIVLFLLSITNAHAQWAYTYGGTAYDYATSIKQTSDGGYIATGYTESFGAGNSDVWLLKLDGSGNVIWQKTYGGTGRDYTFDAQQTEDGGYLVTGMTNSFSAGDLDVWLLKLDGSGNVTWEKTYGGIGDDSAASVRQTEDGGYIVAGGTSSFGAGSSDFWLLKLDGSGNVTWEKAYGGTGYDYAMSIKQSFDKGYIVAGYTSSFGVTNSGMWIIKVDENGVITWQKTFGGTGYDYAESITQTQDGGYLVAGETTSFGAGDYDLWIIKLDENGVITWQKTYGGTAYDYASSITQTQDVGYLVAASTESFGAGRNDLWLIKLDNAGAIAWEKTYGGSGNDGIYFVNQVQDGTIIAAGGTDSFGAGNRDFWLLKLDSTGSIGSCPFEGISTAIVSDTAVTAIDTNAVPITSTATITNTTATVTDTTVSPNIVCSASLGLERLKVGSSNKKNGEGTVTSREGLIACPDSCQAEYTEGFNVTLSATPSALSTFLGWKPASLGCLGTDPCQVTMDKKKSVKAVFQGPNRLKVVTTLKNGAAGTVTSGDALINCPGDCEELYILNAPVTLTANAGVGSTFVKWTGKPCKGQQTNVCTFTMEKNATVKAIFAPTS